MKTSATYFHRRLRCAWRGHDPVNPVNEGWHCQDCEDPLSYYQVVTHRGLKTRIKDRWSLFAVWLKCPDCGKRFGRHDDDAEHIPF